MWITYIFDDLDREIVSGVPWPSHAHDQTRLRLFYNADKCVVQAILELFWF